MAQRFWKVALLALLVAPVALGTATALKSAVKPPTTDIPVLALFSDRPGDKITGDSGIPYAYQGTRPGEDYLVINKSGSFVMGINAPAGLGRYANLEPDTQLFPPEPEIPTGTECANASFLPSPPDVDVPTTYWFLRTYWKCRYVPHVEEDGTTWTELIRSTTRRDATILNLNSMQPGETVGVSVEMMRFRVRDNTKTLDYDESQDLYGLTGRNLPELPGSAAYLLVTATDWNGDGIMDWILRTIPGKIVIKQYDRADDVLLYGDGFKMVGNWPCEYGTFSLPFELKIAKK